MTKVALRGLAARKLRAAITVVAVLLGVAFIAGSYVLTDTINRSFDDIFDTAYQGTDVAISGSTTGQMGGSEPPPFSARYLDRVRQVDGVEKAAGGIFSSVRFVDEDGDALGHGFAPQFVTSVAPAPFETLTFTEGRPPRSADETALDESTSDREGLGVGDTLRIAGEAGVKRYEIVGLQRLGDTSAGGSGTAALTLREAQRLTGKIGEFDGISVQAAEGVNPAALAQQIGAVLPPRLTVETGQAAAQRQSQDIKDELQFLRVILLVFGGVALLVGSFLIFNTFSITVAQRIRELGLLRTLGATRRQILRSMVLEAVIIGALGSVLGLFAGIGVAAGLNALFKAFGIDLPNTGTVIAGRTVVLSIVVGMLVTLAAALVPALRATRVTPMAALLEAELPEARARGRVFAAVAALLTLGRHRADLPRRLRRRERLVRRGGRGGRGRRGHAPRRVHVQPAARAPDRLGGRLAARAAARHHRPLGARERRAQARSHGRDLGGAHDRPWRGGLRHGLRGRTQRVGLQRSRSQLPGRPGAAVGRLHADPPGGGRRGGACRRREDGVLAHARRRRL